MQLQLLGVETAGETTAEGVQCIPGFHCLPAGFWCDHSEYCIQIAFCTVGCCGEQLSVKFQMYHTVIISYTVVGYLGSVVSVKTVAVTRLAFSPMGVRTCRGGASSWHCAAQMAPETLSQGAEVLRVKRQSTLTPT